MVSLKAQLRRCTAFHKSFNVRPVRLMIAKLVRLEFELFTKPFDTNSLNKKDDFISRLFPANSLTA